MTNHTSNFPKNFINVDRLAVINDARKVVEVVLNLAIEANRGLSAEECEVLAAITRLIDECAEASLDHLYENNHPESPDK